MTGETAAGGGPTRRGCPEYGSGVVAGGDDTADAAPAGAGTGTATAAPTGTAAKNGRLYRGGTHYREPTSHLISLEVAAKRLYPGVFGEFTTFDETPDDERLFDRGRGAPSSTGRSE